MAASALTIFSFMGPPFSGKGTLAQKHSEKYNVPFLSVGDLCRKHLDLGTDFGSLILTYLQQGKLIPDNFIVDFVSDWVLLKLAKKDQVVLDGFPRTSGQAKLFFDFLRKNISNFKFKPICFKISQEEVLKRISDRLVCQNKNCQAIYSSKFLSGGFCEICGSFIEKRGDDVFDKISDRLKRYPGYERDILNFYDLNDIEVQDFVVDNKTQDQVFEQFVKFFC